MIEIHREDENVGRRYRPSTDEHAWFATEKEIDDDELDYFGIVFRLRTVVKCPYNKNGEYIPRSKR